MYKCIMFDFDGTLADTENMAVQVAMTLAEKYNFRSITPKEIPYIKSMGAREAIAYMGVSRFRLPFIIKAAHKILKEEVSRADLCQMELYFLLEELSQQGKLLGVITSNSRDNVEGFLDFHKLTFFNFIRASTIFGKARHFARIIKKYSLDKHEVLYVGDEIRDIHAAKRAGIVVAAVTWGFNTEERLREEEPDYIVNTVDELKDLIGEHHGKDQPENQ